MVFRKRTAFRRGARKRAVWINIPFGNVQFTETSFTALLLAPEDWEAQFTGDANETAVLRAIVGNVTYAQSAAGTVGGTAFWGIYIADKDATVFPVFTVAGMGDVDWLHTHVQATATSVTGTLLASVQSTIPVNIKAKRRLKSRDSIYITGQFGADAASPSAILGGLLRFLVARD